jgi:LPS-assembly lipoprotein
MKSVQVVKDRKKADVILSITNLKSSKEILSLSSAGKAREYLLIETIDFTLRDNDDIEWMPAGEISVERTYLYDDSQRLAREIQEADIHDEIMRDMAQQILRRLQNAKKP